MKRKILKKLSETRNIRTHMYFESTCSAECLMNTCNMMGKQYDRKQIIKNKFEHLPVADVGKFA